MRLDYNKRVIDALAKALGKTSEQVERILIDSGVMRPNIPLEPFENGWYISHDREWMLYKRGEDRWESVRYNVCGSMSIGATDWEKTGEFIGGTAFPLTPLSRLVRLPGKVDELAAELEREKHEPMDSQYPEGIKEYEDGYRSATRDAFMAVRRLL